MIRRTVLFCLLACSAFPAFSQGTSTDLRAIQLYAFGGATGTYTGLSGGRNLGLTAGVDLGYGMHYGLLPQIEVRGTYPMDKGNVVSEKSASVGLKVEKPYGRYHPYGDFLFGRGQMEYAGAGYLDPTETTLYQRTNSNVWSPGGGIDVDITQSFAVKGDFQYQHWKTPVTVSGSVYSKEITVGVVYRFGYKQKHPY